MDWGGKERVLVYERAPGIRMTADTAGARRLTLVVCLAHAGFIRHYRPVLELLAERGHRIYVAFSTLEKDAGDARLAEDLAATHDGVTTGLAAQRDDRWRAPAALARSLIDLARYADPRYAAAPELRARAAREVSDRVRAGRGGGRLRVALGLRLVRFVAARSSAAASRRLIRILAAFERAVPTSGAIDRWLRELDADAVLVSPMVDFGSSQVEYVKSARALGVPSAVCDRELGQPDWEGPDPGATRTVSSSGTRPSGARRSSCTGFPPSGWSPPAHRSSTSGSSAGRPRRPAELAPRSGCRRSGRTCSTFARRRSSRRTSVGFVHEWIDRSPCGLRRAAARDSACSSGRIRRTPSSGAMSTSPTW